MTKLTGRFIVENWETEEIIAEFNTHEEREAWLENYVDNGHMMDGTRVSIYDIN